MCALLWNNTRRARALTHTHTGTHARTHTHTHTHIRARAHAQARTHARTHSVVRELDVCSSLCAAAEHAHLASVDRRLQGVICVRHSVLGKKTWCLTSTETVRLIRDGEKGGRGYGGRGRLYTYRYTVTTRMIPALRWAAMRAILCFSRKRWTKSQLRLCPQTTTFLRRKERRSGIEPRSFRLPA